MRSELLSGESLIRRSDKIEIITIDPEIHNTIILTSKLKKCSDFLFCVTEVLLCTTVLQKTSGEEFKISIL